MLPFLLLATLQTCLQEAVRIITFKKNQLAHCLGSASCVYFHNPFSFCSATPPYKRRERKAELYFTIFMNFYPFDGQMLNPVLLVCVRLHACVSLHVCQHACQSDCKEEGSVCNHLIQTYTRGISLLDLTVPFEPYLVSISRPSFGARCRNLIPFV